MVVEEAKLVEYILGMLTHGENLMIEEWYKQSPENEKRLDQIYFILCVKDRMEVMNSVNPEEALSGFKNKLRNKSKFNVFRNHISIIQRVAAFLCIPLFLLSAYLFLKPAENSVQIVDVVTNAGMVSSFKLPDGTKVWLNSGSRLSYPTRFNDENRTVKLEGQGFFDVVKNPDTPFIVKTEENYSVKVYGTEFNVSAYKDDNYVETTLVSGSIELFAGNNSQKVKPGEKTIFDKRSCDLKVIKVNTEYDTAWKDGSIIFKNHTMEDVLKILGRHYNVRFVVKDQRVMSSVITGKFDYEQLPQLMEYLKIASGIKYEIKKPQIRDGIIIEKSVVEIYK